ncbi:PhoH family protein [Sutterella sp.]|uniref:PhoH family protein n=1 Tax=Sutterella sp. TaxID=1981025 RepID=UPI0026E0BAB1|nr:PhoH family protein [Sutterella sp.]MDO5531033.1 PhoH family protein [Sutterella sp.]
MLAHLCGPLDENIRQIETILSVTISRRGGQFRVSGEQHAARRALRALEVLLDRVKRTGVELSPDDIQWHFVGNDDEAREAEGDGAGTGEIMLKTRRRDLRGRTPNQRAYLQAILSHDISFGIGPAGTGKTYLAVAAAVDAFERGTVERIVLTRPAVEAGERLGFLPGDLAQKVDPYLRPLYDALFDLMGFDKAQRLMERQAIEVAPLAYMRGRTLNNAFVILDEAQNTTGEQMKMFLTRIGFGSKAVITGDITQIDLPKGVLSGLKQASKVLEGVRGISFTHFRSSDVVRHPLVARIVEAYEAASAAEEAARKAEREARKAAHLAAEKEE